MRSGFKLAAGVLALAGIGAVALAQTPPATVRDGRIKAMFDAVDTDKDGYVSRAEADGARQRLRTRMETDAKARRDRAFARLDGNKDGSVSRAEFDAAPRMAAADGARGGRAMRGMDRRGGAMAAGMPMFERLDADKDGRVSLAEARAWQPRRWAMRGERRGGHMLPPGHPPVPGAPAPTMPEGDRPLGGGRN